MTRELSLTAGLRGLRIAPEDILAGVSVAVLLIPQSLAYAQLAGFPAYRGLFAAAIPPLVAAPFSSSPYLQPGPTAITSLLTFGALSPLAPLGSARYVELGLLLALMVGVIRLLVGILHAGVIAYLMSQMLLVGFVPAAAILIVASQLPSVVGVRVSGGSELRRATIALSHAHAWRLSAILIACCSIAAIYAGRRAHRLFPSVLMVVTLTAAASYAFHYKGQTLGPISSGFPPLTKSLPLADSPKLVVSAVVIALLGFVEASAIARTYATSDRRPWSPNSEFLAQGAANLASAAFGGFPVGASFSRSALNRLVGAKTSASGFVTGAAVLAFIPLGFLLAPLPQAVLAATVIVAVIPLIRFDRIAAVARLSRIQFSVVLAAFVLTLALSPNIAWAILAALLLSISIHLWRELRLDLNVRWNEDVLELSPQGVLWFGNARLLEDRFVEALAAHPNAAALRLDLGGLGRIDLTGALAIKTLVDDAARAGLDVGLERTPAHANVILDRVLYQTTSWL